MGKLKLVTVLSGFLLRMVAQQSVCFWRGVVTAVLYCRLWKAFVDEMTALCLLQLNNSLLGGDNKTFDTGLWMNSCHSHRMHTGHVTFELCSVNKIC